MIKIRYKNNRVQGVPSPRTHYLGRPGPPGPPGSSQVTSTTGTDLTGYLRGNGAAISSVLPVPAADIDTAIMRTAQRRQTWSLYIPNPTVQDITITPRNNVAFVLASWAGKVTAGGITFSIWRQSIIDGTPLSVLPNFNGVTVNTSLTTAVRNPAQLIAISDRLVLKIDSVQSGTTGLELQVWGDPP